MSGAALSSLLFYLFAAVATLLALAAVTTRRILRAAVYLMGVLMVGAGFYLLLDAEFLAGIQVLVYVGGIVILLVFAVMLTRSSELLEDRPSFWRKCLGGLVSLLFLGLAVFLFSKTDFSVSSGISPVSDDTVELGRRLLDSGSGGYVLPFEILSLLLLSALLGGIVLARRSVPASVSKAPEEGGS